MQIKKWEKKIEAPKKAGWKGLHSIECRPRVFLGGGKFVGKYIKKWVNINIFFKKIEIGWKGRSMSVPIALAGMMSKQRRIN